MSIDRAAREGARHSTPFLDAPRRPLARAGDARRPWRLKDRTKIERVLGRLHASYASVADLYEMAVRDGDGQLRLHWRLMEDRRARRDAREGTYLLRTNLEGQTVEELWTKYIQLTEAEAAFCALKSDLAVRPVFPSALGDLETPAPTAAGQALRRREHWRNSPRSRARILSRRGPTVERSVSVV